MESGVTATWPCLDANMAIMVSLGKAYTSRCRSLKKCKYLFRCILRKRSNDFGEYLVGRGHLLAHPCIRMRIKIGKNLWKKHWVGGHPPSHKNVCETSIFWGSNFAIALLIEYILTVSAHVTHEFSPVVECPVSMADICFIPSLKGCFTSILYYVKIQSRQAK